MSTSKSPSQRRYPPELRERAVRMVREAITENGGERFGVVTRVARQLGIGAEPLRTWVNQAEVDDVKRPGVTTEKRRRIAELEKENRELRRANEILKSASAFLRASSTAAEQDDPLHRRAPEEVRGICQVLEIAPSTYYEVRSRPASSRRLRDAELKVEIERVRKENLEVYGIENAPAGPNQSADAERPAAVLCCRQLGGAAHFTAGPERPT